MDLAAKSTVLRYDREAIDKSREGSKASEN